MDVIVIRLWPRETECVVCGEPLVDCHRGVPVYEDVVLPDSWSGGDGTDWPAGWGADHGGHDACDPCCEVQATLHQPATFTEVRSMSRRDEWDGFGCA